MGRKKVIFSGLAWTVIQNAVNILYGLIAVPFLINHFGKEEYGLIGLALSINAYVALLDMGMTNSNVRFFSEYIAKKDLEKTQKLFNLTHLFYLVVGILNTILLVILSFFVDSFFKITPDQALTLRNLIWILALNATFSWLSTCFDQFLRANELIDWIKKRATFLKLMLFVVLICTIVFNWPLEWYFFGFTFMGTLILPLTLFKTHRIMPSLRFGFQFDPGLFKIIFPYALSLFSFNIFHFIVTSSRPLFLGNIVGAGAVAELNVMATITSVVTVFTASLMQVLLPILTKLKVTNDNTGVQTIMMQGTKYATAFITVLILIFAISSSEVLTLYVGEDFKVLSPWLVLWLLTLLLSHRNVMTALVFTEKRLTPVVIMGASAMVVALICYALLVPVIGVGGVVVGWSVHEVIHTVFYYVFFIPRYFHINTAKVFLESVLPSWIVLGIAAVLIFMVTGLFETGEIESAVIKTVMAGVIMAVLVWTIILNRNDKEMLISFFRSKS